MTSRPITRRRALAVVAATAATATVSGLIAVPRSRLEWRGTALGADAAILLDDPPASSGGEILAECIAEIHRLESIFSLHQPQSELARLNNSGSTPAASLELRELLGLCRHIHHETGGRFDPTVQPLWRYLAGLDPEAGPGSPDRAAIAHRLSLVGFDRVRIEGGRVELPAGGALTLNGIAQGYITDRIVAILQRHGFRHVLADIGEVRAIDGRADGTPFRVAIRDSGRELPLQNAALATSSPDALVVANAPGFRHILDPRTGSRESPWTAVTVRHASAAIADGLSTALSLASAQAITAIVETLPGTAVWARDRSGRVAEFGRTTDIRPLT